jgi:hypothetical protein
MSAAHLDLTWNSQDELESQPVAFTWKSDTHLVRAIGRPGAPARCPECASIVYSRRHRLCGVCSQPLPDHLLFTIRDAQRIEQLLASERVRHRRWLDDRNGREQ